MREISFDHHDEHGGDDHDGEDDDDNDGTATLPMTHACVKLLPPMPSRSLLSWLLLLLSSHPIRALRISSTFTQEVGKYSLAFVVKD